MFDKIINAITLALSYYDLDIYSELIKQDFSEPCFFIQLLESNSDYRIKNRRARLYSFDIRFHDLEMGFDGLNSIGDELYDLLEYIESSTGEIMRARDMNYEIQDNILHFFVKYYVESDEFIEHDKMTDIVDKVGVKVGS